MGQCDRATRASKLNRGFLKSRGTHTKKKRRNENTVFEMGHTKYICIKSKQFMVSNNVAVNRTEQNRTLNIQ